MSSRLPQPVSTVLFDVGNTLHHLDLAFIASVITKHARRVTTNEVAIAEYQAKAEVDAQFRERREEGDAGRRRSYFETILDALGVEPAANDAILEDLRLEDARHSLWRVMHHETPAVVAELRRRGFTLGVVSNADGRVPAALEASKLAAQFAAIVDSHLVGVEKPDPRIFAIALEGCKARATETIYVGDIYEIDVQGARRAGITPILLDPLSLYGEVDCLRIDALARLLQLLPG